MSKKFVDDCGGLKPIVAPRRKDDKGTGTKKTDAKSAPKKVKRK